MNNVESVFLTLLRNAILNESSDLSFSFSEQEWRDFIALAYKQGTPALVFNQVLSRKETLSESLRSEMRSACARQMMQQPRLQDLLKTTFTTLQQADLHPVLLKGFGLAELYPRPELRAWGDLDVYVGPDQYHHAAAVLRAAFPNSLHHDKEWEELKHYNFVLPDGLVEMHRVTVKMEYPNDQRIYYTLEQDATQVANVQHLILREPLITVDIPEAKFNMLFTFLHAWNHFVDEGLGMKQLCDVFLLARSTYQQLADTHLDSYSDYLVRNLKALHLTQAWQLIGYILVEYLHLPEQMWIGYWGKDNKWLKRHGEVFFRRVIEEGVIRDEAAEQMKTRYSDREKNLRLPLYIRKLKTLKFRFASFQWLRPYSDEYARHKLIVALYKGIKRLFKKDEVVLY